MNQRITKWLLILCATMLGACSADTDLLGPASVQATAVAPGVIVAPSPSSVDAGPQTPRPITVEPRRRGRYAMAAN